ncbi:MAG: SusC/RagA family TonB-linked outer membrane protein [Chitinophagaceae bacterium]|nr:SusC/RagA family TonB-linked outer membrane protein [Chitinophagaceae bacterium]
MRSVLILTTFLLLSFFATAQKKIYGKVVDEKGNPVTFASITVKGQSNGLAADSEGNFSIASIPVESVIIISAQGYQSAEVPANTPLPWNIVLKGAGKNLSEVVVTTALGINRTKRSVGYATQQLTSNKITSTKVADINTAIAGKIAGIQIRGGSGAKFGTSSIRLRGINTLGGGNPIYVVDGVITNSTGINPDDVESLNVLKGPAASALYGQRGSEGAVVITTKKGSKKGIGIEFNHAIVFENVYVLPDYQNEYGGGASQDWLTFTFNAATMPANLAVLNGAKYYRYDVDESWGPKMDGTLYAPWYAWDSTDVEFGKLKAFLPQPNNVKKYFNTGVTNNTSVAFSKVTNESNTRVSFTNITRTGVVPNSKLQKNWVALSNTLNISNNLTIVSSANYVYEHQFNIPAEGYGTQTTGSFNQWFHRDIEIEKLKRYKRPDGSFTTWNISSPTNLSAKYWDNPYTEANENISNNYIQRLFGAITASYKIANGLKASIITRGNFTNSNANARVASYTLNTPSYRIQESKFREINILGSLEYEKKYNTFSLRASAYAELMKQENTNAAAATSGGFIEPNVYNVSNSLNEKNTTNSYSQRKVNSIYGFTSFGYKNFLFLDLNIRNDISSTLPINNNSYVYGGVSSSFVFSELLKNHNVLSFGKIRASIAKVGTDVAPYSIYETYTLGNNYVKPVGSGSVTYSTQSVPNVKPNEQLEPSLSTSYEIGTELQFLNNRIRVDFNYYFREAKGQIIPVSVPGSTGYLQQLINAGNIQNYGYEFSVGAAPVKTDKINWDIDFNLGINKNKVVELANGIDNIQTALDGSNIIFGFVGSPAVSLNAKIGKPYGQIIGNGIKKDANGRRLIDDNGFYVTEDNMELGNILPKYTGGLTSAFNYKNFFVNFSLDFQKGGKFISTTKMFNAGSGLAAETAGLNDKGKPKRDAVANGGGIRLDGVNATTGKENTVYVDAKDLYEGALFSVWENWMYDASYIKLREISIGYNLPKSLFKKLPFHTVSFSVTGQNLWLIASKVKGIDPSELEQSWLEGGQLPGTRSLGVNLKLTF